jgi:hypothetical protein
MHCMPERELAKEEMAMRISWKLGVVVLALVVAVTLAVCRRSVMASAATPKTLAALEAEIQALKPAKLAWREIAWKSCLLEGLKESRERQKPVLLWVFIDRPADDARC